MVTLIILWFSDLHDSDFPFSSKFVPAWYYIRESHKECLVVVFLGDLLTTAARLALNDVRQVLQYLRKKEGRKEGLVGVAVVHSAISVHLVEMFQSLTAPKSLAYILLMEAGRPGFVLPSYGPTLIFVDSSSNFPY